MGILVPPCLTMVVLGSLVNLSIVTLFLAGLRAGVPARRGAARADRAARAAAGLAGQPAVRRAADLARAARRAAVPTRAAGACSSAASSAGSRRSPRRRCSRSSTRSSPACCMGGIRRARDARAARAERRRHRDDAVGAGRGVGVRVDPGARVGAADARRVDRRRRRGPRRLPGADRSCCSSSSARCSRGCRRC